MSVHHRVNVNRVFCVFDDRIWVSSGDALQRGSQEGLQAIGRRWLVTWYLLFEAWQRLHSRFPRCFVSGLVAAQCLAFQVEAMAVMHEAIEDGVGERRLG